MEPIPPSQRKDALEDQVFWDCSFEVQGKIFNANKTILALSSEVFKAMFFSDMKENTFPVKITDLSSEAFDVMLKFIYGQGLTVVTIETAIETLRAANKYLLSDLMDELKDFITSNLKKEDIFQVYDAAKLYNCAEVIAKCQELFITNTLSIIRSEKFMEASLQTLEDLFGLDDVEIDSEKDLILALNDYIQHHKFIRTESSPNKDLEPVIRQLRFSIIPIKELSKLINPLEWLYWKEKYAILANTATASELCKLDTIGFNLEDRGSFSMLFIKRLKEAKHMGRLNGNMPQHICYGRWNIHSYSTALWNCGKVTADQMASQRLQELSSACERFGIQKNLMAILDSNNKAIFHIMNGFPASVTMLFHPSFGSKFYDGPGGSP